MPLVFRSRLFLAGVIVLAVVLCYMPAMRAGFVWDDDLLVTENPLVKGADSLPYVWGSAAATDYTPLTITAFWLEWRLWAENAAGYHLVNILLQALSAVLLWRVLERLDVPGAWLGGLLFAVHPVNVASVAWVAELKNGLSLPFYLGAIACYLRYMEKRRWGTYGLALVLALCAWLSKGSTVVLPLALVLCVWWKEGRVGWRDMGGLAPFFLLAAGMGWVTVHLQARVIDAGVTGLTLGERVERAGEVIWFYLGKDLWPWHLCAIYPKWKLGDGWLPLGAVAGVGAALWVARDRWGRGWFFAWAYFVTALLPVLGFLNMGFLDQAWVADWWQQLALPAVTGLAGAGIAIAWARAVARRTRVEAAAIGVGAVCCLGVATWNTAAGYESMETLCRRTLAMNPGAWMAHNNLGAVLTTQGRLPEAAAEYEAALALKPGDASARSNLGIVYARQGRLDEAIAQYHEALALAPDNAKYWFNLGNALRQERRTGEALEAFGKAIDEDARWTTPRYEMGTMLLELGRAAEAGRQAETIVALMPDGLAGHYLLARAAAAVGHFDTAKSEAGKAVEIARKSGDEGVIKKMLEVQAACENGRVPEAPDL
jgi:tetratricopeptide (TPR) repeat protein